MIKTVQWHDNVWYVAVALKDEPPTESLLGTLIKDTTYLTRKFPLQGVHKVIVSGKMLINGRAHDIARVIPQDMAREYLKYTEVEATPTTP